MKKSPENLRAFFAIDPPDIIRAALADMIRQMQQMYKNAPIRWVRPEHLHITLQFIASIAPNDVAKLMEHARHELKLKKSFPIMLNEIELFPSPYQPRVISIKVEPQNLLSDLAKSLGVAIRTTGYETESRPYRGHLTLGRIKESRRRVMLEEYKHPPIPAFRANILTFYRSEPTADGSQYYPLEKIYLS